MTINRQLDHSAHKNSGRLFPLSILADNIRHAENIGSLFRLADALGIQHIYLGGESACPPDPKIRRTSRSTEKSVAYSQHDDAVELAKALQAKKLLLVALEISTQSLALSDPAFQQKIKGRELCLVLGSENTGVEDELLQLADISVHIPMQGQNSSMNVATAAAIACYEIIQKL